MTTLHDQGDERQLALGPAERGAFLTAVLHRYGPRIVYSTCSSEHAPRMPAQDRPWLLRYRGDGKRPEPSCEGISREDHLMDVITKMLAHPGDYCLPEFADDGEPDPMTDHYVTSTLFNANREAERNYRTHQRILGEAKDDPTSWLQAARHDGSWPPGTGKTSESAEQVALRRLEHLDNIRRIAQLPRKLYHVAMLTYEGSTITETASILGVHRATVWRRLEEIRSPRIRAVLGL